MGLKVVPSDDAHKDSHPSFYEGNHWGLLSLFLASPHTIAPPYST